MVISSDLVCEEPTQVIDIFHKLKFIPLKVYQHYSYGFLTYEGWSPFFMIIPENGDAPVYKVSINKYKPVDRSEYGSEFIINVDVGDSE